MRIERIGRRRSDGRRLANACWIANGRSPESAHSRHDADGVEEPYEDDDTYEDDDSVFPPSGVLAWPASFTARGPSGPETEPTEASDEEVYEDAGEYDEGADVGEDTWLDGGIITFLIVAGAILFVFPEPATSGLGVLLLLAGVVGWIIDALG